MRKRTIIITGGHHNSALVVAQALIKKNFHIAWVGHKHATHSDTNVSAEFAEVTANKIPFYNLRAGKLDSRQKVINLLKFPIGLLQARKILTKEKPIAIISFGSYIGATVSLVARLKGIPIYMHEQTVVAGKANLFSAKFARRIYLTWDSSQKFYPASKTLVTGLPLRKSITSPKKTKLFKNNFPTILVLGGKQGSHIINKLISQSLGKLLPNYNVIHQTGTSSVTNDYDYAITNQEVLPDNLANRYQPRGYISESEIGHVLASADIVISRSGAHITYELALLGTRSLLIPYLHTHNREQLKNAHILERNNQAIILPESYISTSSLMAGIKKVQSLSPKQDALNVPKNATSTLIDDLLRDLHGL